MRHGLRKRHFGLIRGLASDKARDHAHQCGRRDGAVTTQARDENATLLQRLFLGREESRNGDHRLSRPRLAEQPVVWARVEPDQAVGRLALGAAHRLDAPLDLGKHRPRRVTAAEASE